MKCPFCAEQIQDDALICRFCGAARTDGQWRRDQPINREPGSEPAKPGLTIRFAAVFFILSAVLELLGLQSPIPMLGQLRSGSIATGYHLFYAGLFLAMGVGLWTAGRWGYRMMFVGTAIYTLDKIRYLLDASAREQELTLRLQGYEGLLGPSDQALILQSMNIAIIVSVLCWWGFLLYIYFKRKLFLEPKP